MLNIYFKSFQPFEVPTFDLGYPVGTCCLYFPKTCKFFFAIVTLGCGSSSAENNSYFEVSDPSSGQCKAQICKSDDNVCQVSDQFDQHD